MLSLPLRRAMLPASHRDTTSFFVPLFTEQAERNIISAGKDQPPSCVFGGFVEGIIEEEWRHFPVSWTIQSLFFVSPHLCLNALMTGDWANVKTHALTYEARWGRIGLDVLLSVALDHIPEPPHVAGVKDVEGLVGMGPSVLHVRPEQVVVGTGVPLRESKHPVQSPLPCQNVTLRRTVGNSSSFPAGNKCLWLALDYMGVKNEVNSKYCGRCSISCSCCSAVTVDFTLLGRSLI